MASIGLSRGKLNQAVLAGADLTQAHLLKAEFAQSQSDWGQFDPTLKVIAGMAGLGLVQGGFVG